MIVRVATEEDWPAIKKMVRWLDSENVKHRQKSVETDIVAGLLHAYRTDQEIIVAEGPTGELVGFCAWVVLPRFSETDAMGLGTWVHPSFQRSGIGRHMRQLAARKLEARGVRSVVGVAAAGNEAGLRSVLEDGFLITGYVVKKELRHEGRQEGIEREQVGQRQGDGPEELLTDVSV